MFLLQEVVSPFNLHLLIECGDLRLFLCDHFLLLVDFLLELLDLISQLVDRLRQPFCLLCSQACRTAALLKHHTLSFQFADVLAEKAGAVQTLDGDIHLFGNGLARHRLTPFLDNPDRRMVDAADLVIAYVENSSGGAYKAMAYAEKTEKPVINLATDCEE